MSRPSTRAGVSENAATTPGVSRSAVQPPGRRHSGALSWLELLLVRGLLAALFAATCAYFRPFGLDPRLAALGGLALALTVVVFEMHVERAGLARVIGAVCGLLVGVLGAYLFSLVLGQTSLGAGARSLLDLTALLAFAYTGLVAGAQKGELLNLQAMGGVFGGEPAQKRLCKVLDTSVIIDGRVVDICEARFLDGTLLIPQFVLRELQMVADSPDPLKRQRGRRGLEVLQHIQKMAGIEVEITEDDFPHIPDVDMKLIELAKRYDAKIVTNDYNLNKVATLQGLEILNINLLANALKPVVLPGEVMRVFILREGKEYNQGVAYLDDGTMVVVDGARKLIGKTVDIIVTSVHQTTAGKMIFGRCDERGVQAAAQPAGGNAAETAGPRGSAAPSAENRSSESHAANEHAPRPVFPEPSRS